MAQVSVTTVSIGSADSNTIDAPGHVHGSGDDLLLVGVVLETTASDKEILSVVIDPGGNNEGLTRFTVFNPSHGKFRIEVWRGLDADISAQTATVRATIEGGNSQKCAIVAVSLANVDQTTPLSGAATQGGTGSSGSVAVTQDADDLAFCFAAHLTTGSALDVGGGETEHADFDSASLFRMWAASEDGDGATTLSWTQGESKERSTLGFIIEAAGAAGDTTAPNDATHGHGADVASFTQVHDLVSAEASHAHSAEAPSFVQGHVLTVSDATHAHSADNAALTQGHVLTATEAAHDQVADNATLTQDHVLVVADATHIQTTDVTTFTEFKTLVVAEATHAHAADAATLTQGHVLNVQDAAQAQTADVAILTQGRVLVPAEAIQGHSAVATAFEQIHVLSPADADHGQAADGVTVVQGHILSVVDAGHGHDADEATVEQIHALVVANSTHGLSFDVAALEEFSTVFGSDRTATAAVIGRSVPVAGKGRAATAASKSRATTTEAATRTATAANISRNITAQGK